jgi:hypothetical protein
MRIRCLVIKTVLPSLLMDSHYSNSQERLQNFEKRLLASSCTCVCLSVCNNSAATGLILMNVIFEVFSRKSLEKTQVSLKSDKNNGYYT